MGAGDQLCVRLTAEPASVRQARRAVEAHLQAAGISAGVVDDVVIAVGEAVSNAVAHAYRHVEIPGGFVIDLDREADELQVTVRDEGCGPFFNGGTGMGVRLMSSLSKTLEVKGTPGVGTQVRMTFATL